MSTMGSFRQVYRLSQLVGRLTLADKTCCRSLSSQVSASQNPKPLAVHHRNLRSSGQIPVLRNISKSTNESTKEYVCPSHIRFNLPTVAILDQSISGVGVFDCPTLPSALRDVIAPEGKIQSISEPNKWKPKIEAKHILKIRRRKMNRHSLKKYRKKLLFTHRKQRQRMMVKKRKIFEAELDEIRKGGQEFDAKQYVLEELRQARRGGFYVDVLASRKSN